ncbi:Cytochrome c [Symmachiella dynata]|uniref:Cytochrome c n=1 Tax=Symmachiella dynata TaxID=2527995 RepID=A0A517ZLG2_9PLAN|nr:PVC-type heme-binding CxxCH protein [Symmachiella dynata]QDU43330.1 Cytochrome c [Symmachiella dynata]
MSPLATPPNACRSQHVRRPKQCLMLLTAFVISGAVLHSSVDAQDPFRSNIRPTPKLSPADEQATFTLPPGFEIQLFAAEPDIAKPLNMAFDARGRLWVTNTIEYPYPAPEDRKARDSVKILEDTNGDGRADKITTFADNLNVPIGVYPYKDGAIVFSIPYIWRLRDTDGDGRADKREKLFGPMSYDRDTHGLNNSFRRGYDGWLYACHGFNNETTVSGADGHTITMNSGNTYRMRLDGSRIEHYTWGQVNPFGMVIDELGNLFTADCHSKPIYQMLRGAYYPSFGKPDDGLGFVPPMMEHGHGSTAIAGIAIYDAPHFPPEFQNNIFTGNVMTSRVNRDSLVYHGSTILAHEEPDFLTTTDPWFRPVDVQLGMDGALYVADFYNRIIGHYEVPLDHPGRDRESGRIWRITYTGDDAPKTKPTKPLTTNINELITALGEDNLKRRTLAMNTLADDDSPQVVPSVRKRFRTSKNPMLRSRALWILHRRGSLQQKELESAANDSQREVRVHAMKVLSEIAEWSEADHALALAGLRDQDPFVQRAAADALGQHPNPDNIRPLLDVLPSIPAADNHLRHVLRMALRNQLRDPDSLVGLPQKLTGDEPHSIAPLCLSIPSPQAGSFLLRYISENPSPQGDVAKYLEHAARYIPPEDIDKIAGLAREKFADNVDLQLRLLTSLNAGLKQRGVAVSPKIRAWSEQLATELLDSTLAAGPTWTFSPLAKFASSPDAFGVRTLPSEDGKRDGQFIDSKAGGEQPTGVLRSPTFAIPEKLSFYLCGHLGVPDKPAQRENFVRLRSADDDSLIAEALPPRHDVARREEWDLSKHAGQRGYLEIVDGLNGGGYAWLAAGRFQPPVVKLPHLDPALISDRQTAAASLIEQFQLQDLQPRLAAIVASQDAGFSARANMSRALVALAPDTRVSALVSAINNPAMPQSLRNEICQTVVSRDPAAINRVLAETIRVLARRPQEAMAEALAVDAAGAEALLTMIKAGHAPPQLLQNQSVRQSLAALKSADLTAQIDELTADLPPAAAELEKDIQHRKKSFAAQAGDATRGRQVFEKNCSICHRIGTLGKVVGPQLDGIGNRGSDRVIEDMLDPNRNVDVAFQTTTLALESGKVVSGLLRREEGAVYVLIDNKGEEFTVPQKEVDDRFTSRTSLMPEGLTKAFSEQDFNDLLAFLLQQTAQVEPKQ